MAVTSVRAPFPAFVDSRGIPLDDGSIYIGELNANPLTTPKSAYWDEGLTLLANQPIRTSRGLAVRNGSPARFFTDGAHSILVFDQDGSLVHHANVDTTRVGTAFAVVTVSAAAVQAGVDVQDRSVVFCNTSVNDVTVSGLRNGVTGQVVSIIKTSTDNTLTIKHDAGAGFQDMYLFGGKDAVIDGGSALTGGMRLVYDGQMWREVASEASVAVPRFVAINSSSSAVDVSGVDSILVDTSGGNVDVGGTVNAFEGQILSVCKVASGNTMTISHNDGAAAQKFTCFGESDITVAATSEWVGGAVFVFNGTFWRECAGAY